MKISLLVDVSAWRQIIWLILFHNIAYGSPNVSPEELTTTLGIKDDSNRRILDPICDHTYARRIFYGENIYNDIHFVCMATFISPRRAIAAAHCFDRSAIRPENPHSVLFFLEDFDENNGAPYSGWILLTEIHLLSVFPSANQKTKLLNDVAFVQFGRDIVGRYISVTSFDLPLRNDIIHSNCKVITVTNAYSQCSIEMYTEITVSIIGLPTHFYGSSFIGARMEIICPIIGQSRTGLKRVAAGSPLICNGKLHGFASWASINLNFPQFFINISSFKFFYEQQFEEGQQNINSREE